MASISGMKIIQIERSSLQDIQTQTLFAYREDDEVLGIVVLNETQDEEYGDINWSTKEEDRNIVVHRLAGDPINKGRGLPDD